MDIEEVGVGPLFIGFGCWLMACMRGPFLDFCPGGCGGDVSFALVIGYLWKIYEKSIAKNKIGMKIIYMSQNGSAILFLLFFFWGLPFRHGVMDENKK